MLEAYCRTLNGLEGPDYYCLLRIEGEVSPKPIKPTSEVSGLAESGPKPCESRSRTSGWTNPPPPPPIKLRRCHDNHSN
ncbi:hypothetical protein NPIL_526032 [Nephila pilipes]|uniref:Uncharacterized protein n=1 Tax=Nephila pilipes TaxID=299642 RepID=A0A8X6PZ04_NEPPI|nr:hypothetical protein NPIL_526032 [Nephila pilipes]